MSATDKREMLAKQIAVQMKRDPAELVRTPDGRELLLWQLIAETADKLPKTVRTALAALDKVKPGGLRSRVRRLFRRLRRSDGWTHPEDALPGIEYGVMSGACLIRHEGEVKHARLMYGTPVGSHRWVLGNDRYVHVLEIDGWMETTK